MGAQDYIKHRTAVFQRDDFRCKYCGKDVTNDPVCDHIVPPQRGGTHDIDNLNTCCRSCNVSKGRKLLEEWIGRPYYEKDAKRENGDRADEWVGKRAIWTPSYLPDQKTFGISACCRIQGTRGTDFDVVVDGYIKSVSAARKELRLLQDDELYIFRQTDGHYEASPYDASSIDFQQKTIDELCDLAIQQAYQIGFTLSVLVAQVSSDAATQETIRGLCLAASRIRLGTEKLYQPLPREVAIKIISTLQSDSEESQRMVSVLKDAGFVQGIGQQPRGER